MKKIVQRVGTGMTQSTKRRVSYECKNPDDMPALEDALRAMQRRMADPWSRMQDLADDFQRRLDEREGHQPGVDYFAERAGAGWYMQEIIMHEKLVRHHIDAGSASWAAFEAMAFGSLLAEMLLKFEHEPTWETGAKQRDSLRCIREQHNRQVKAERQAEWTRWQAAAADIWRTKPELTATAVAQALKTKLKLKDSIYTIRTRIRKGGEPS